MLIKRRKGWEIADRHATDEGIYLKRREFVAALGLGGAIGGALLAAPGPALAQDADPSAKLYPAKRSDRYGTPEPVTGERQATTYNNYYEFDTDKSIWRAAQKLKTRPWTIAVSGMVEKPFEIGIDDLVRKFPIEERLYRHRCVEAWSMAVPWSGFALKALVDLAKPLASAKYVVMTTFMDPAMAPGQKQFFYPWPYTEGLTMAEATNELAFIATGIYGKPLPKQNGAPLRLAAPWKYGFKSTKGIQRFIFTDERPQTYWMALGAREYGFWANVNPEVPHPRWSQASEEILGTGNRVPTLLYNGYGDQVASLYNGLDLRTNY